MKPKTETYSEMKVRGCNAIAKQLKRMEMEISRMMDKVKYDGDPKLSLKLQDMKSDVQFAYFYNMESRNRYQSCVDDDNAAKVA